MRNRTIVWLAMSALMVACAASPEAVRENPHRIETTTWNVCTQRALGKQDEAKGGNYAFNALGFWLFWHPGWWMILSDEHKAGESRKSAAYVYEFTHCLDEHGVDSATLAAAFRYDAAEEAEIRRKANNHDVDAAVELARVYHELDPLVEIAERRESTDAYELFIRTALPLYAFPEATRWLCSAANANEGQAQLKLGFWHLPDIWEAMKENERVALRSFGLQADARVAYMWYTLASQNGIADATSFRGAASAQMNHEEIRQAEQMARDWKPGQCPSPLL